MADKLPSMPLYVSELLGSTEVQPMTTEEFGAFMLLLTHAWQSGDPPYLPNDPERLRLLARVPKAKWAKVWACVGKRFSVTEDGRIYDRLSVETWHRAAAKREKCRDAIHIRWERNRSKATDTNVSPSTGKSDTNVSTDVRPNGGKPDTNVATDVPPNGADSGTNVSPSPVFDTNVDTNVCPSSGETDTNVSTDVAYPLSPFPPSPFPLHPLCSPPLGIVMN